MDILQFLEVMSKTPAGILALLILLVLTLGVFGTIITLIRAFRNSAQESGKQSAAWMEFNVTQLKALDRLIASEEAHGQALERMADFMQAITIQNGMLKTALEDHSATINGLGVKVDTGLQQLSELMDIAQILRGSQVSIENALTKIMDILSKPQNGDLRKRIDDVIKQVAESVVILEELRREFRRDLEALQVAIDDIKPNNKQELT